MVNLFRLKSIRVTFDLQERRERVRFFCWQVSYQTKRPILIRFSKTRIPVGVRPSLYSSPSLPITVCKSTPYISNHRALFKYWISQSAGVRPLCKEKQNECSMPKIHWSVYLLVDHFCRTCPSNSSVCFWSGKSRNSEIVSTVCSSLV